MKLLLAEDEKDMAAALVAVLEHSGYEVDAVRDGRAALALAHKGTYACMVFDVMMPVMDGVTALKELRAAGDTTPVLLLTAKAEVGDRIEGLDAGADDYLPKPFAMGELLARLRSLTRRAEVYAPVELSLGSVTLDVGKQELAAKSAVRLASKETQLMQLLMMNAGKVRHDVGDLRARVAGSGRGRGHRLGLHLLPATETQGDSWRRCDSR